MPDGFAADGVHHSDGRTSGGAHAGVLEGVDWSNPIDLAMPAAPAVISHASASKSDQALSS